MPPAPKIILHGVKPSGHSHRAELMPNLLGLPYGAAVGVARNLLRILDAHCAAHDFFTGISPTLADVALYSYLAKAPEGGVSLDGADHLRGWLRRVEASPGFAAMPDEG